MELHRLHRRFGHPSATKLYNLLKKPGYEDVDTDTHKVLEEIVKRCPPCQLYAKKPSSFRFTLHSEKNFNQSIFVDICYIDDTAVLYVVDESTRYHAARFLRRVTAEAAWRTLLLCYIDTYLGPPDQITHDAGKQFVSGHFQSQASLLYIATKEVPIECANSMTFVERYHEPLRKAYNLVKAEAQELNRESALQTVVKAINDSVGPGGLVPTLLVYGAFPRLGLPTDKPAADTHERALALRKDTEAMTRHFARTQVQSALKTRNGPQTLDVHKAALGSPVLVYRQKTKQWEGPFPLLNVQGETCSFLCPDGPKNFRVVVVKPFSDGETAAAGNTCNMVMPVPCGDEEIDGNTIYMSTNCDESKNIFAASRKAELDGLLDRVVFVVVPKSEAEGKRIYGGRFVDQIKNSGKPTAYKKSRYVVQAFNDKKHGLMTYAPTVQRASQRLLLAIAAQDEALVVFSRNASQAYTQSKTKLSRYIYVKPPEEMNLSDDVVLHLEHPL